MIARPDLFDDGTVEDAIKQVQPSYRAGFLALGSYTPLAYAIQHARPGVVKILVKHGAKLDTPIKGMHPLVWALCHDSYGPSDDAIAMVLLLLTLGCDSKIIPAQLIEHKPPKTAQVAQLHREHSWALPLAIVKRLHERLNCVIRYYIRIAQGFEPQTLRKEHSLAKFDASGIIAARYGQVGQRFLGERIEDFILYRSLTYEDSRRPLVAILPGKPLNTLWRSCARAPLTLSPAGTAGHGKTYYVKNVAACADAPLYFVDLAGAEDQRELFGSPPPFHGCEEGSPLNNFLAENNGKTAVILLDELDKCGKDIREAWLHILEEGELDPSFTSVPFADELFSSN